MRKRNTESLGEVLKQFFEENQFFKQKLAESRVITGWGKTLGPVIDSYTTHVYLKNNILYVSLTSSVLRSELMMCKEKLITNLNTYAGLNVVKDIVFR